MNRNVESHFSELPKIDIERSIFDRSSSHKTSFNVGELIPFFIDEVLPGDTFNITTSCVVRLQTLLTPIMDNMYLDTYYFFVPNRLIWSHWKQFMGENTSSAWIPQSEYTIPHIAPPENGWNVGTIADYFGIPVGVWQNSLQMTFPSALPFRAYALICDQWFRDQNLTDPINIYVGDSNVNGSNGSSYVNDVPAGGKPFKVAKYHDYFTSCLPAPQKGPDVGIFPSSRLDNVASSGVLTTPSHFAPVYGRSVNVTYDQAHPAVSLLMGVGSPLVTSNFRLKSDATEGDPNIVFSNDSTVGASMVPANLWADMSQVGLTVNELRVAFQLQKFYEKNARAGTRYREILKEHFGITTSDARMQIPEYLGGHRIPLSIHQVANQSQGETDFLGDLGAMSNTSDVHEDFIRSFEEHGYVIGVCCVRYDHSYPQGLERFWMRRTKTDYYFPVFANIGEQKVHKDEIFWKNYPLNVSKDSQIFGYQEAWAEYRSDGLGRYKIEEKNWKAA